MGTESDHAVPRLAGSKRSSGRYPGLQFLARTSWGPRGSGIVLPPMPRAVLGTGKPLSPSAARPVPSQPCRAPTRPAPQGLQEAPGSPQPLPWLPRHSHADGGHRDTVRVSLQKTHTHDRGSRRAHGRVLGRPPRRPQCSSLHLHQKVHRPPRRPASARSVPSPL